MILLLSTGNFKHGCYYPDAILLENGGSEEVNGVYKLSGLQQNGVSKV